MKLLCLIIDSTPRTSWQKTYEVHRSIWNKCLDKCSAVDGYFLRSDPSLATDRVIEGRCLTIRGPERGDTILNKTLRAVEALLTDHDYVIRTNISSLYDFPLLQCQALPKEGFYAGHVMNNRFVSGSGMILSRDVARKLLLPVPLSLVLRPQDDVAIWQILNAHGVRPQHRSMFIYDYTRGLDQISVGQHIHYRLRDERDPQRLQERRVTEHIFAKIYGDD